MEDKKKKILNIIEAIISIVLVLLACSWLIGYKVKVDDEGNTTCYNFWNKEVDCR